MQAQFLQKTCAPFSSFKVKSAGICISQNNVVLFRFLFSKQLHIRTRFSNTMLLSVFLWGDQSTTWLRVLCEAINYRIAAGVSAGAVLHALLS